MLKYMLDTNICIYVTKNKPPQVKELFSKYEGQMCISSVTLMELIFGIEKSSRVKENMEVLNGFTARLPVLNYDSKAAEHTGQLRAELEKKGQKIGCYDALIGAHARSQGLIMVTNNVREFERIPGLRIEDWVNQES